MHTINYRTPPTYRSGHLTFEFAIPTTTNPINKSRYFTPIVESKMPYSRRLTIPDIDQRRRLQHLGRSSAGHHLYIGNFPGRRKCRSVWPFPLDKHIQNDRQIDRLRTCSSWLAFRRSVGSWSEQQERKSCHCRSAWLNKKDKREKIVTSETSNPMRSTEDNILQQQIIWQKIVYKCR